MVKHIKAQLAALNPAEPTQVARTGSKSSQQHARGQKGPSAKPRHLEDDLQKVCVAWFRLQYPALASLLFAIPNGGKRDVREAVRLKQQGVTAGVPDLFLAVGSFNNRNLSHGLFLELKTATGRLSPDQAKMLQLLNGQFYTAHIVYSLEDFQECIAAHLMHGGDRQQLEKYLTDHQKDTITAAAVSAGVQPYQ